MVAQFSKKKKTKNPKKGMKKIPKQPRIILSFSADDDDHHHRLTSLAKHFLDDFAAGWLMQTNVMIIIMKTFSQLFCNLSFSLVYAHQSYINPK